VVGRPGGIRAFPYDGNFPDNFGQLGTGRYDEVHNIGEIWAAALLEMNRNIGANLGLQLVVDALKLTPANPSFLDGRDAILAALDAMRQAERLDAQQYETAFNGIWTAFAHFGMGPAAQSNGASLVGVVADFSVPAPTPPTPPTPTVEVEATPNLAVPDNQEAGIADQLVINQTGRIKEMVVSVDIEHTWIGDLRVSLSTPAGKTVVLHDREGSSRKNLIATYRSDDVLGLADLLGDQVRGSWVLHVADRARADIGTLRRWALEFVLESAGRTVQAEATPAASIPDNNPAGVSSNIDIARTGTLLGVKARVDITHSWIGDLRVELIAPSGQAAILHDQSGGSEDNIIRSYDSVSSPGLATLIGQGIQGVWRLQVRDLLARDVGKLNRWSLELTI